MLLAEWHPGYSFVRLFHDGVGHSFHVEIVAGAGSAEERDALDGTEALIVNLAVARRARTVWIHGACLGWMTAERTYLVLLVAPSGGGKTTLSLGLLSRGFRLLTDDVVLIGLDSRSVVALPTCPKVRENALEMLAGAHASLPDNAALLGRYVLLPETVVEQSEVPLPIAAVIFLNKSQGHGNELKPMTLSEGVRELFRSSNLPHIEMATATRVGELTLTQDLFAETRFYALPIGDLRQNLDSIEAITKSCARSQ